MNKSKKHLNFERRKKPLSRIKEPLTVLNDKQIHLKKKTMIQIAIIEDQAQFRDLWREILNYTEGYQCVAVFNTISEATAQLPFLAADIVLMGIPMQSNRCVADCMRLVRKQSPKTQFLVFMASPDDECLLDAIQTGATGYILKKTNPLKILEAIAELHEMGCSMPPAIARHVMQLVRNNAVDSDNWGLEAYEWQMLKYLAEGLQYKEISSEMHLSMAMVKLNIHTLYQKLKVPNRTKAVNKYLGR